MDYSELNKMLGNLEISSGSENKVKEMQKNNETHLSRDLLLKTNFEKINHNLVNPQRDFIQSNNKTEDLNNKIHSYNFIQKKKFILDKI